jgi:hypothetical protein
MTTPLAPGMRVRRKADGRVDSVQRLETAANIHGERFQVVIVRGVVYLPKEWEPVEEGEG